MPSYVQTAFIGGEISQAAQGRIDLPSYKLSMNACLNGIPLESGAWQRRPGTQHVAASRGGATGRVIKFAFEEFFPYQMAFTDGFLRMTTGPALVMTNDQQAIASISTANPAVIQTQAAHGWSTGNSVMFNSLGANSPLLQNRQFLITVVDSTHFSIADAITGASIDGSTLGSFVSGNVTRILEIATNYTSGSWSNLRSVQAEMRTILLNGTTPQVLQVVTPPTATQFATFSYGPANFVDGPYLDPIATSIVTPSGGLNGVITLTLSFTAYDSTKAYNVGDFVTFGGQGYQSLTALNQGNEPDTHPSNWLAVNGGAAVNGGTGFVSSDIGRLIRLFSEPALWSSTSTYSTGNIVAYSDGQGGFSYWTATGSIAAGVQPGTSTSWALNATGAQWTWAQVVSVSGAGLITPATPIGNLTAGGGLNAAFDGNTSKNFASGANYSSNITTYQQWGPAAIGVGAIVQYGGVAYEAAIFIYPSPPAGYWASYLTYLPGQNVVYPATGDSFVYEATQFQGANGLTPDHLNGWIKVAAVSSLPPAYALPGVWTSLGGLQSPTYDGYIGQHYVSGKTIQSATLYPTSDAGLSNPPSGSITVNLRASNSSPTSQSNGTLLGQVVLTSNTTSPINILSNNNTTTFTYVWFEIIATFSQPLPENGSHIYTAKIGVGQVQFFSANVANGSVITAQIRGPALLYNQTIRTWQLGVYSDTTGWPTCGAYHEGRIWLGGVISNRFDACVSNGFVGTEIDFTPTAPNGTVADSNSISYICDGENSNLLLWMKADQQGVLFATQEGPWLISAPSAGAMSPTNIQAVRINGPGTANIEPQRAEHTLIYVHKFVRKVVEFFADVFSGKFSAPNLSERAKHLTVNGIAEIGYQQELAPVIWARRTDGALVGATYKRDTLTTSQGPNIIGWHRHQLGSSRLVESISVGPSVGGNLENLSMVTNDLTTGVRHIELMTDLLDEGFLLVNCMFLDNAITPSSTVVNQPSSPSAWSSGTTYGAGAFVTYQGAEYVSIATGNLNNLPNATNSAFWLATPYGSLTVNGLWDHNGKTVTAFIAGLDCGDFTVVNGSIYIPFGDGISAGAGSGLFTAALVQSFASLPAVVGFTYTSQGQLVRRVDQSPTGPTFAELGRTHRVGALLYGCVNGSISFGTDFVTMYPAKLLQPNGTAYTPQQLWSGIWRDNTNSIYDFDNMISWQITRPLPAFVIAVGGFGDKAGA